MDRVAVFVDAGYLFAAGSALVSGAGKQRRNTVIFDETRAVDALKSFARDITSGLRLLRIYWYDGASRKTGPSAQHVSLALTNDMKVRLGLLNAAGEQKGVDSLIVTDMVELARNRAVADMVLMSGDEDVRIGVQLAQSFGVRVHLLGIDPCAGTQSSQLRQEADTCSEWDLSVLGNFISLRPAPAAAAKATPKPREVLDAPALDAVVEHLLSEQGPAELKRAAEYMLADSNNVPHELDGKLLSRCRAALGKKLDDASRRYVRARIRRRIWEAAGVALGSDRRPGLGASSAEAAVSS